MHKKHSGDWAPPGLTRGVYNAPYVSLRHSPDPWLPILHPSRRLWCLTLNASGVSTPAGPPTFQMLQPLCSLHHNLQLLLC